MDNYIKWNFDFRDKIDYEKLNKKIDEFIRQNPGIQLVIEVPSTKGATSSCIRKLDNRVKIRIAGAFDDQRLENYRKIVYKSGARCKETYIDSVIYTRNETIRILEEIEKIEKGILTNWSDLQKLIYIYDVIKRTIMYDPRYKEKTSAEVRSLRGLLTRQTVCAGYSVILKEMLERQGISCMYVSGHGHAWNVVTIDDVMYPVDLTYDNYQFRHGYKHTHLSLGPNPEEFNKKHILAKEEPETEHVKRLRELDNKIVEEISASIEIIKKYTATSQIVTRDDGSKFYIAQIDMKTKENPYGEDITYYKYYYQELDGKSKPTILYSRVNVNKFLNTVSFGNEAPEGYEDTIAEILFSKENIEDSKRKNTSYIGRGLNEKTQKAIKSKSEIVKTKEEISEFKIQERVFYRKDKSKILIEQIDSPKEIKGRKIYKYNLYEMVHDGNLEIAMSCTIYTELDLLRTQNLNVADILLSKERIEKKCVESGGYIGYIDTNNKIKYSNEIAEYFDINKKIELSSSSEYKPIIIPNFKELEDYAREYEILMNTKTKELVVRNQKTKTDIQDERKKLKIIFAHIWHYASGLKTNEYDSKPAIKDAFSKEKEKLYNQIKNQILNDIKQYNTIDSITLFLEYQNTEYAKIIARLFENKFNSKIIHQLFNYSLEYKNELGLSPAVLIDENYAKELVQRHRKY